MLPVSYTHLAINQINIMGKIVPHATILLLGLDVYKRQEFINLSLEYGDKYFDKILQQHDA